MPDADPRALSDIALALGLRRLAARERGALCAFVLHLAECERRGLHRSLGFSSLLAYCVQGLRLSESEARSRARSARAAARFPRVLPMLGSGTLHLSALALLAPHMTPGNHLSLLAQAAGKGKRGAHAIVAALAAGRRERLRRQPPRTASLVESRRIPQSVKDEVWARDGGRCAFVSAGGKRCDERDGLEFDHVVPWAMGGRSHDPRNIRLLCRAHNRLRAWAIFATPARGP
ncbi:MAG: HNH endonuclease signature motif containing protein [Elusimicrobia bacterium]|nr:HNH endonuclease signature motif containing protein [Elusimicrobiota bacterium]